MTRRPSATLAVVALFTFFTLAGAASCTKKESPRAAQTAAHRVVSLSPSTTEAIVAIGAGDALVGRSRYCDFPPDVLKLPQVGGYADPNLEAIFALKPDLVVGARGPAGPQLAEKLAAHGAGTYFPETESFAQIDAMLLGLGERTGHAAEARAVVVRIDARVAGVTEAVRSLPKLRVLMVFGLTPIVVTGPKSFPNEMLERAGGANAVTEGMAYPVLGMERVFALDPDVIVNCAMAEAHGSEQINKDAPGWKNLRAVKEGKVIALSDESVLRPGPRVGDALAILAHAIHPEAKIP